MTMILALNLSDQILLATDTLVSKKLPSGKREACFYYPKLQQYVDKDVNGFVGALYAGNFWFSRYLGWKIADAVDRGELPTDIHEFRRVIPEFLAEQCQRYDGPMEEKSSTIIFAGTGSRNSVKPVPFKKFDEIFGPSAFRLEDPMLVHALQAPLLPGYREDTGWLPIRDQLTFSFRIDERTGTFGEGEVGDMWSVICAGSAKVTKEDKLEIVRHFVSRRPFEQEGKDIVTYLRRRFSDSIGGAVMIGVLEKDSAIHPCRYDVDRSGPRHHSNWSITKEDPLIAIDPDGNRIDLREHYEAKGETKGDGGMEL